MIEPCFDVITTTASTESTVAAADAHPSLPLDAGLRKLERVHRLSRFSVLGA